MYVAAAEEAMPSGIGSDACEAVIDLPLMLAHSRHQLARLMQSCESARAQGAGSGLGSGSGMEAGLLQLQSEPVNLALLASLVRTRDRTATAPPEPPGGADALDRKFQQQCSQGSSPSVPQHQQQNGLGIYSNSIREPDPSTVPRVGSSSSKNTGSAFHSADVQGDAPLLQQQQQEHLNGANTRDTCAELSASLRFEYSQQQQQQLKEEEFHSKRLLSDGAIGVDDCSQDRGEERTLVDLSVRSRAVTRDRVRAPNGMCQMVRELSKLICGLNNY